MYENENYLKLVAWLMGVCGSMLLLIGGLTAYIFNRHVADNDCQDSQNRADHREIYSILRDKVDKC